MLTKRGYIVDEAELNMSTEDFRLKFGDEPSRDSLTILVEKTDDPADQLFVFFPSDEKVGVKTLKTYASRMKDEAVFRGIVVVRDNLTPSAKQARTSAVYLPSIIIYYLFRSMNLFLSFIRLSRK
jgi:DNA-directed RNA polymerase I, II, and III subunit RPABC1